MKTLSISFWTTDKQLYDWTINDADSIGKSFRLGVDGMITDDLELVQSSIKGRVLHRIAGSLCPWEIVL